MSNTQKILIAAGLAALIVAAVLYFLGVFENDEEIDGGGENNGPPSGDYWSYFPANLANPIDVYFKEPLPIEEVYVENDFQGKCIEKGDSNYFDSSGKKFAYITGNKVKMISAGQLYELFDFILAESFEFEKDIIVCTNKDTVIMCNTNTVETLVLRLSNCIYSISDSHIFIVSTDDNLLRVIRKSDMWFFETPFVIDRIGSYGNWVYSYGNTFVNYYSNNYYIYRFEDTGSEFNLTETLISGNNIRFVTDGVIFLRNADTSRELYRIDLAAPEIEKEEILTVSEISTNYTVYFSEFYDCVWIGGYGQLKYLSNARAKVEYVPDFVDVRDIYYFVNDNALLVKYAKDRNNKGLLYVKATPPLEEGGTTTFVSQYKEWPDPLSPNNFCVNKEGVVYTQGNGVSCISYDFNTGEILLVRDYDIITNYQEVDGVLYGFGKNTILNAETGNWQLFYSDTRGGQTERIWRFPQTSDLGYYMGVLNYPYTSEFGTYYIFRQKIYA